MTVDEKVGLVMMYYRKKKNLTQNDVAKVLGISDGNYSRIEAGLVTLNIGTAFSLCNIFEIKIKTFLTKVESNVCD